MINRFVTTTIQRHNRVKIIVSKKQPCKNKIVGVEYLNFTKQIENTFEELTNEIVNQLEACAYDYPDEYTCLSVTSPEGHETIHVIHGPGS